ncbi:CinA family nicotinamide mononucleotide deamidase-related protein [Zunongwangia sp. SCSIO 43204]|uniref:CinA family nicotinamide mononucleotide deamidase-related protein n=1 Tax=Zunongwangia sp. SCSIO 43204 TaxID=2779359 RepID=UPI001CA9E915|nr:CinA family nicotinamide mononucleotide deamidase-related protein [Zunongwangia sp. SCSIO 43204]UAB84013.1 CinA family nicotinamide mononucleotide deamidase-related protein [Zunongwangia sp. SCSIO 43204]
MNAEIITIGDEILIGQIIDTNSAYIAKELNKIGVSIHQITSIEDEWNHILTTLGEAQKRADIVIITGGLGPTKDDITKKCLCEFFNDTLVKDEEVLTHVEELFEKYIDTPISDLNRMQALVPSKAEVLKNSYGTAPGMWLKKDNTVFVSMPGVPYEMKALMQDEVIPRIRERFKRPFILHKTVLTLGMGESAIAEKIESWEEALPAHIRLAYLPNLGKVRLRLSTKGSDPKIMEQEVDDQIASLSQIIGDIIKGVEEEEPIEVQIGNLLKEKNTSLATAESFTGGRLASIFTKNAGSSAFFKGSVVAYATEAKVNILGVSQELIDKYSVVSNEVACEMARKVKALYQTDYAIATTGNAGPSKGDSDADVGTVFLAIATPDHVFAREFNFGNHRDKVVGKAVNKCMELVLEEIYSQK